MAEFGYAGQILKVDLSSGKVTKLATSDYADKFIGGRGIAAKIYWDEVSPEIKAFDPKNYLIFTTGPVAGFMRLAGSRWQVCGKSPATEPEIFSHGNLGGSWGSRLKFAGCDSVVVHGKSEKPVYLVIHDGTVEIRDASSLWGRSTIDTQQALKAELGTEVRVLAIGPAGENLVSFATLLADDDSTAGNGFGAVMGSKKLKAIAVTGAKKPTAANPDKLKEIADRLFQLKKGVWDGFFYGVPGKSKRQPCYGCFPACSREYYFADDGRRIKFWCQASDVYRDAAMKYYGSWNDVILNATRLCNEYGLDTMVIEPMISWLLKCYQEGILSEKESGIPLSKVGSAEFIETLLRIISSREGFGDFLAKGTIRAAEALGKRAKELITDDFTNTRASESGDYDPRTYIITGLLYAMESRRPIQQLHEVSWTVLHWQKWFNGEKDAYLSTEVFQDIAEKFWGSKIAADFSTYEGKALAVKKIQDRSYAKESLILCDFMWPVMWSKYSEDHLGDPTLESQVFSAVTGRETDEQGLNQIGERIFNLQRAILMKEGWGGRQGDRLMDFIHDQPLSETRRDARRNRGTIVPGKDGQTLSRLGKVLEREAFEKMKDEYYQLRGWDVPTGFQTKSKLVELGLQDVIGELNKKGLLK